ncbi:unnamed protein product [Euphydryas editha]|uniref:Uncharacterized protein n=1 Tax=Euphydryas editha TaxID=104508 RepID=A0AAU9TCY7_EUPED|nr:unnamed protein product [Euphydryas editha]
MRANLRGESVVRTPPPKQGAGSKPSPRSPPRTPSTPESYVPSESFLLLSPDFYLLSPESRENRALRELQECNRIYEFRESYPHLYLDEELEEEEEVEEVVPKANRTQNKPVTASNPVTKTSSPKPVKKLGAPKLRRSIAKWEAATSASAASKPTSTKSGAEAPWIKDKTGREGVEVYASSKKKVYEDRMAEAKASLTSGKQALTMSRNLKGEYKATLIQALEGLYRLVKEAEATLETERAPKKDGVAADAGPAQMGAGPVTVVPPDSDLRAKCDKCFCGSRGEWEEVISQENLK